MEITGISMFRKGTQNLDLAMIARVPHARAKVPFRTTQDLLQNKIQR